MIGFDDETVPDDDRPPNQDPMGEKRGCIKISRRKGRYKNFKKKGEGIKIVKNETEGAFHNL